MLPITDDKLMIYNKEALIPGPGESCESFGERAEYCLGIRKKLEGKLPFSTKDEASEPIIEEACRETLRFFDISPRWVPVFFSNYRLAWWHGGCAWIFQLDENAPTAAFFQLRKAFKASASFLGIYDRTELMAHEMAHVGRMMFEEPEFEEVLAYRASKSKWRRWWGPLVQSSTESALFVFLLLPLAFLDVYLLVEGYESYYWKAMWLKLIPLGLVLGAAARLWRRQRAFGRTLSNLVKMTGSDDKARAVLYRLTDREINEFSKMPLEDILRYASADSSLRWRLIRLAYWRNGTPSAC